MQPDRTGCKDRDPALLRRLRKDDAAGLFAELLRTAADKSAVSEA
jgi:hypothetical protein